jgi:hypothetical protein
MHFQTWNKIPQGNIQRQNDEVETMQILELLGLRVNPNTAEEILAPLSSWTDYSLHLSAAELIPNNKRKVPVEQMTQRPAS